MSGRHKSRKPKRPEQRVEVKNSDSAMENRTEDEGAAFGLNIFENSVSYRKNAKTGEWEIVNPASAVAYNYLYRVDRE